MTTPPAFWLGALRLSAFTAVGLFAIYGIHVWRGEASLNAISIAVCTIASLALGVFVAATSRYFDRAERVQSNWLRWLLMILPVVAMYALFSWMQRQ